ncbi:MAG: hypothetical protein ABSG18_14385 [Steroidobacteraceae bacterium]|jgi:hypothetical protein
MAAKSNHANATTPRDNKAAMEVRVRVILGRLWGRLKHGLLTQEVLDRLARLGLVIYPYFVAQETASADPQPSLASGHTLRMLTADDAAEMIRIDSRFRPGSFISRLAQAECLGLFVESALVGYTWAKLDIAPIPGGSSAPLFALQAHEAYLFDLFVDVGYRGRRLAEILRWAMQYDLARRGRTLYYSYTLAFNRSPRRLMARNGVRDIELRLFVGLRLRRLVGLDARLWRRAPLLRTRWLTRVVAGRPTKQND